MDEFAEQSHRRVLAGRESGHYGEIVPLVDAKGNVYAEDDGVRADSSVQGLAACRFLTGSMAVLRSAIARRSPMVRRG